MGTSEAELKVIRRAGPPSDDMTYTSEPPSRLLAKAIRVPSGLQTGLDSYDSCVVSCTALPPSAATL